MQWKLELKLCFIISLSSTIVKRNFLLVCVRHSHSHLSFPISCISPSFSLQYFLCTGEKQVLSTILFFLLQTLQIFFLLLISAISLLISFLGLPLLIKILCSCVLLTSWNGNMSFVHVLQYQISSFLFSNSLYSCLVSLAHFL